MPGMASGVVNSEFLLLFNATTWTSTAINATVSPYTNLFLSLHTNDPIVGNQTTNECNYTSYARVSVARTSGGFTVSSNTVTLAGAANFPQNTGVSSNVATYWGLGTNTSGAGNLWFSGPICANAATPLPFTCTNASPGVFTSHAHGYAANQPLLFWAATGTLPTGITAGTIYYVISTGLTTDAFEVSTSVGGSAVNTSSSGDGLVIAAAPITISQNVTPSLTTSTVITGI